MSNFRNLLADVCAIVLFLFGFEGLGRRFKASMERHVARTLDQKVESLMQGEHAAQHR
jgi:hypothetical protein